MARLLVLILYLSRLADAFNFRKDYSPPLFRHLESTSGIEAWSLICGLHRPERMAISGLDDCDSHIFGGTCFARWRNHMLHHFRAKRPKFWWIVTGGLTQILDDRNLTKTQRVLFELYAHAYCFIIDALSLGIF